MLAFLRARFVQSVCGGTVANPSGLVLMPSNYAIPRPALIKGRLPSIELRRLFSWLSAFLVAALLLAHANTRAAEDFLPPEQAFKVTASMVAADRVEVQVRIAKAYYLYREAFRFVAQGASLGAPAIPQGQVKFDENFQKNVETYRELVSIALPLLSTAGPFILNVVTQGCADAGLCYPPMTTVLAVDPAAWVAAGSAPPAAARVTNAAWWEGGGIDAVLQGGQLWAVTGVFLVLGLLMTFTPCVLPMLPILSSLIVGAGGPPSRARGIGLAAVYSLGMALVYTLLGVAAGLAGEGLAGSLQKPWVLTGFAALLALLALSMFDVYELRLPASMTQRLSQQAGSLPGGQMLGVFLMGGLSALIVSPCVTAPLAGALLFIGQSGDVVMGGLALFAMAAGMSVPLLLLGASAGRWLPRAGAWMQTIKRWFGVLMLAVALWVLQPVLPAAAQLSAWGLLLLLSGMLTQPFARQLAHHHPLRDAMGRALGLAALTLGVLQIVGAATGGTDPLRPLAQFSAPDARSEAPQFQVIHSSAALDDALRKAAGRPVLLDFYADWCVSCKEMERMTFTDTAVAARMRGAVLLKADVTANSDDELTLLRRFKLFGPPGTLFFDAQGQEQSALRVVGFQSARRFEQTLIRAGL